MAEVGGEGRGGEGLDVVVRRVKREQAIKRPELAEVLELILGDVEVCNVRRVAAAVRRSHLLERGWEDADRGQFACAE